MYAGICGPGTICGYGPPTGTVPLNIPVWLNAVAGSYPVCDISGFLVEFFDSNEEGMRVDCLYRRGRAGRPRGGGATGPLSRLWVGPPGRPRGGDRPPCTRGPPARDLVANLKKKNYI